MSPWVIAGSGLGFVRLIRLFPFSSESGVDEQQFSPTATEKWGLQRNREHTSVDSHKPLKNRIPVLDLSGVGVSVVSYFCSCI